MGPWRLEDGGVAIEDNDNWKSRRKARPVVSGSERAPKALANTLQPPKAWSSLPMVAEAPKYGRQSRVRLISMRPEDPASKAFDVLRTRLLRALQTRGWKRVAIAAPTLGCGSSFATANLGLSLGRIPTVRTLMMDLNLRKPGLAQSFNIRRTGPLEPVLSGAKGYDKHIFRIGENLGFGLNDEPMAAPAGLLQDPTTWARLDQIQKELEPDVMLCDLPPLLSGDEVEAVLPHVDGVLLITDGTKTTAKQIAECELLLEGQAPLLGVVLNRAPRRRANRAE